MVPVIVCLLICLVGLIGFCMVAEVPPNSKLSRILWTMWWVGLFTFLMRFNGITASVK